MDLCSCLEGNHVSSASDGVKFQDFELGQCAIFGEVKLDYQGCLKHYHLDYEVSVVDYCSMLQVMASH